MKRPILVLPLLFMLFFSLASCHKTCTCIEMNGREHVYTREEVEEANGGSCDDMIYMFNQEASGAWLRFYSICSWD
ncbi:MAG: hypothetical protein IKP21_00710 [Bacteroidales bacterium]|nr:hypothetical protein [Bacteroidales bacterium]